MNVYFVHMRGTFKRLLQVYCTVNMEKGRLFTSLKITIATSKCNDMKAKPNPN